MKFLTATHTYRRSARLIALVCLMVLALSPARAAAQQGAATTILGQVTDENGGALPGVTVTLRGPALQVPEMTSVTDARGEYRLTPLPIGVYSLQYELSGFQGLRLEGVKLTSGFVAKLDQILKIGAMSESITVSGQSPLVDVTQASTATALQADSLELIPSGTNGIVGFLAQVPGARTNIDVGGSSITDTNIFTANGQTGESWQLLEGVFAATAVNSASGTHYDFNAVEEGRFQTSGNNVETPKRGMAVNLVMKSGGNSFHGMGEYSGTNFHFQSDNIGPELKAQGVVSRPKLITRKDGGGNLGGKLIENKLWFFADLRYRQIKNEIPFAVSETGGMVLRPQHQFFQVYKLSEQLNENNKLIAFWHRYGDHERRGASQFVPERAMEQNNSWAETWKGEWQHTSGNWLTFSAQWGHFNQVNAYTGYAPGIPLSTDIVTLQQDGDAASAGRWSWGGQEQGRAVATMYKPNLGGNHVFTTGFTNFIERNKSKNPARRSGDYRLRFSSGSPFQIDVFNTPVNPITRVNYYAGYVQDSWTIGRRLTINPGIRAQRDHGWVPEQCQEPGAFIQTYPVQCRPEVAPKVFNTFTPRLYFALDVMGDGKSVLKGGYGKFVHLRDTGGEISQLNLNGQRTTTFTWHDLNNNRNYDPGEVNLDPNGGDFVSGGNQTQPFVNPNEKVPNSDEFSVAFERQVMRDVAVRAAGVYARNFDVQRFVNPLIPYSAYTIPYTSIDPGPDGNVATTADNGGPLTYYDYPAEYRGARFQGVMVADSDPKNNSNFKTLEVSATKRLANNWQLISSYSATRRHVPFAPGSQVNPNTEINIADDTWIWIGKLAGSYVFPKGIVSGASYSIRNGDRLARQVLLRPPAGVSASVTQLVVNAAPIGSLSLDNVGLLDLRVAKRFRLGQSQAFELRLDCFNALNANPVTSVVVRAGPTFGNATASESGGQNGTGLTPPRVFQIEGHFSF